MKTKISHNRTDDLIYHNFFNLSQKNKEKFWGKKAAEKRNT